MPKSGTASVILGLVAVLLGLLAGFLSWFNLHGSGFTLVSDSYRAVYVYATQGSSALSGLGSLGSTVYNAASSNPIVVVTFGVTLVFWPALIISGLIDVGLRNIRVTPFVWGLIAFLSADVMMNSAKGSLAIGGYLDLGASILWIAAFAVGKVTRTKAVRVPAEATTRSSS